jgi:hypothetical protein
MSAWCVRALHHQATTACPPTHLASRLPCAHSPPPLPDAQSAIRTLSRCLLGPHIFLPMEIASIMLLATASVVMFCSFIRCVCRTCWPQAHTPPSEMDMGMPTELSDAEEDDEGGGAAGGSAGGGGSAASRNGATSTTRAAQGGSDKPASSATAADDEDDLDELPAYGQVVEGGSLTVQPLNAQTIPVSTSGASQS